MFRKTFDGLMVSLASMEDIESWSHGAVDNPDTINYRTGKPKAGGLFCESIFGPINNFECACGKYKGPKYKGIVCEKCNVEVTSSRVRRTRMGHVDLASPIVHAWYKNSPSGGIHQLLGISSYEIDKILNFVKYIVVKEPSKAGKEFMKQTLKSDFSHRLDELNDIYAEEMMAANDIRIKDQLKELYVLKKGELNNEFLRLNGVIEDLKFGKTIIETDFRCFFYKFPDEIELDAGPSGIYRALKEIDVEKEIKKKVREFPGINSPEAKKKAMALIKLLINLYVSGVKPENMVFRKLPVIPPESRPVIQLNGKRFASSDINLFYRRVLMRNIRLKKMVQVGMPDILKKNEIRLLQESVNNLLVGEKSQIKSEDGKVFKSLSDLISGKDGIFRRNLLGKRVDYSGRSVITVGPGLKLDECGLPVEMAIKMFTPFLIGELMGKKIVYTPNQAEKLIKDEDPIVLKFLEDVIKNKYILLNRAPTLHRLNIQAFKIKLFTGKSIRLHPLVCEAFNADFDGDQMAVHLPLTDEAQEESRDLLASNKNILKPGTGELTLSISKDMALGIYYLTDFFDYKKPEINTLDKWEKAPICARFSNIQEAVKSYINKESRIKDKILILLNGEPIITTVGRAIFNYNLPKNSEFINCKINAKDIKKILNNIFDKYGLQKTTKIADKLKDIGFKYATLSGTSISLKDFVTPKTKEDLIKIGSKQADEVYQLCHKGFISEEDKHRLIVDIWSNIRNRVEEQTRYTIGRGNNLYTMIDSNASGSQSNITQICGMKGLVINPQGEIVELPVTSSFSEGLSPIEYFIASHTSRKGKADTAIRTTESGYLSRKLYDACQEVIVRKEDCKTNDCVTLYREELPDNVKDAVYGRVLAKDLIDTNGIKILDEGTLILDREINLINRNGAISEINIRSPLTCNCASGVCQKCYGIDLTNRQLVKIGEPVGVVAAQSIGEVCNQFVFDSKHTGGVAGVVGSDVSGIDRITQLLEMKSPKHPAIIVPFDGTIEFDDIFGTDGKLIKITGDPEKKAYIIKDGYVSTVKEGDFIPKGGTYAVKGKSALKVEENGRVLSVEKDHIVFGFTQQIDYKVFGELSNKFESGKKVYKGTLLTNNPVNIQEYKNILGIKMTQKYIINEIKKVYSEQGQKLNDKHIEVVVKQLFSKVFIEEAGDSSFIPGKYVKYEDYIRVNRELSHEEKEPAKGQRLALGLTSIAKLTDSWLSAASFQETIRIMVGASLAGAIDTLSDLKSNVIIGRLLPLGENYRNIHGYRGPKSLGYIPLVSELLDDSNFKGNIKLFEDDKKELNEINLDEARIINKKFELGIEDEVEETKSEINHNGDTDIDEGVGATSITSDDEIIHIQTEGISPEDEEKIEEIIVFNPGNIKIEIFGEIMNINEKGLSKIKKLLE